MKIGIVTTWFERGAAYVSRQYRDVLDKEHDVFIYARGGEDYAVGNSEWDLPYVTWGVKDYQSSTSVHLPDFKKWLLTNEIDLVIFNEQRWWPAVQLCNELKIKNGAYIDYYTEKLIPYYGLHDFLICNTKRHLSAFDWHPQALYIPWGTDTDVFEPQDKDFPELHDPIAFFNSAGVSPLRKGTDLLIKAFYKVKDIDGKIVIHSQVDLKESLPELGNEIKDLENKGKLQVINQTVTAPGLYHMGDVYVYPSRLDGIGLSLPEAISCGLVPVTVDFPPMNEFVNGEIGYTVPVEKLFARSDGYYWPQNEVDIDKLAEVLKAITLDKNKLREQKNKAREYAKENLNWDNNASLLLDKINDISILDDFQKEKADKIAGKYDFKGIKGFIRKHPKLYKVLKRK